MQHVSITKDDFAADFTAAQTTTEDTAVQKPLDSNCQFAKWEYFTRWIKFFKLKFSTFPRMQAIQESNARKSVRSKILVLETGGNLSIVGAG
jgi:hypothetical protein